MGDTKMGLRKYMLAAVLCITSLGFTPTAQADEDIIKSHALSVFGKFIYDRDFKHFSYVNPVAPKGGTFSTWGFGTFDSLNPYILKGQAAQLSTSVYDTLMTGNLEEPGTLYGLLAETVEYPRSREWAIFHIRPEARFADGSEVTADDVVFTFETLKEKGRPSYKVTFKWVTAVEALDKYKVKFTFDPKSPLREQIFKAAALPVFSKNFLVDKDFADLTLERPMGSGPYRVDEIDPGRKISYALREDYWARDLPVSLGANNFAKIEIEYYADYTTAFEGFKAGNYVFREEFFSKTWATAYNFPAIDEGRVMVERLPDGRLAGTQGFFFNLRREKFQDIKTRQAISLAFNFEWSNASLFYDLYERTDSFWENSKTLQASQEIGETELALIGGVARTLPDEAYQAQPITPSVSAEGNSRDRRNLRRAAKLLDEAGWSVGDDGLRRNAQGEVFEIEFLNDSPSFERIILPYVENLVGLGIKASSKRVDNATATELEKRFEYDIVTQRFSLSHAPGDELLSLFGSETANIDGSSNKSGVANGAIDELIEIVAKADSRENLDIAVRALDHALRSLHIWIPQWYNPKRNIAYYDIFERPYAPEDTPPLGLGQASIWWINPDKAAALAAAGVIK